MGGMTDALINLAVVAEQDDAAFKSALDEIGDRYSNSARELLDGDRLVAVLDAWSKDSEDVIDVLKAIALVKSAPQRSRDVVAGYGEIWSARLLAAYLEQQAPERGGRWVDARDVVTVSETHLGRQYCGTSRKRRSTRSLKKTLPALPLLPDSSQPTKKGCRPRWAETAATTRPLFLLRCLTLMI